MTLYLTQRPPRGETLLRRKIIVSENGAAFKDKVIENNVADDNREDYLKSYIAHVLKAKNEGVHVTGYFVWTLLDNFEWAEGFHPRFGLVHVDFTFQQRILKSSGKWYGEFLKNNTGANPTN